MSLPYQLEKSVWTEADFETMGWYDSFIHAFAIQAESFELLLDIDYIFKWVAPGDDKVFSFWVAPATLVFWNVSCLRIDLEPHAGMEILDLHRGSPARPLNAEHIGREIEWAWSLETNAGQVSFRAAGYMQHVRQLPRLQGQQSLSLEERGGYSFARPKSGFA